MKRWLFAAVFLLWFSTPALANVTCDICVSSVIAAGGDSTDSCANTPWDDSMDSVTTTFAAGDLVCVADDHAESSASDQTIVGSAAEGANDSAKIICVDVSTCTAGSCEVCDQPSERAMVTATSSADVNLSGKLFVYGFDFVGSDYITIGKTSDTQITVEQSSFDQTGSYQNISFNTPGYVGAEVRLVDVDFTFSNAGLSFSINGKLTWDGGSVGGTIPATLIKAISSSQGDVRIRNVDLSLISGDLVLASGVSWSALVSVERCKFHATLGLVNGIIDVPGLVVRAHHCQSGSVVDPPYQMEEQHYEGTIQVSTTNVRTGGASDGTTDYAWEFDTSTGSNYLELYEPLCSTIPIPFYVSGGSEVTARVFANGGAGLDDTEIWFNVSEPPIGATSLGVRVSSRAAPGETTSSNPLTEGAETWTSGTDYYVDFTFTPAENGLFMVWPCVATSAKVYIDPKIELQ